MPLTKPARMIELSFLRLEKITKYYWEGDRQRTVLQDVDASFSKGEFVAILGKSGSGKSTLLNLIGGIDYMDGGEIWIRDSDLNVVNLTQMDERQRTLYRRKNIGFIFQFFNLIPTLTVIENVALPLELGGVSTEEAHSRAMDILKAVELEERHHSYPDSLSGGEQQRVALARALVHNPLLVLADEPTGNLDEGTGKQVLALLDRLTRQSGKNLILVTHSREVAAYADRILYLREGSLTDEREKSIREA